MRIARVLVVLPIIGVLAAWMTWGRQSVLRHLEEESRQRAIVADVRGTIQDNPSPPGRPLPRRGKVLIWDLNDDKPSASQRQLPPELQARSSDDPITIVIVRKISRERTTTYDNGDIGYRQLATVEVFYWPEKTSAGAFTVAGDEPPMFVSRSKGERGPVLGEIDEPLATWAGEPAQRDAVPRGP